MKEQFRKLPVDGSHFVSFIKEDMDKIRCDFTEAEIQNISKKQLKKFIYEKIVDTAFKHLKEENEKKKKTKHIVFLFLN